MLNELCQTKPTTSEHNASRHKHFFTSRSFDYFINERNSLSDYNYTKFNFKRIGFWYGWPAKSNNQIVNIFKDYIAKNNRFYDQHLSLLLPIKILTWELEVIK